uniref:LamG-like jellyroll fold domain-containing protein n=1 Tax=viral metagenome TaxID=1070528 RepID=A0A6C0HU26_9ZZZZ
MNAVAIILGIVIIILFFVLYKYFTTTAYKLSTKTNISLNTDQAALAITKIDSATSNQYAYGIWVYINTWKGTSIKTIFTHDSVLKVYIDENKPILNVDVTLSNDSVSKNMVVDNFPLQKWVFIIVSMDTSFLDVYLDGKLLKSFKINDAKQPPSNPRITLGNQSGTIGKPYQPFDAVVTLFYRWSVPMDPGTAWNYYMKGNGQGGLLSSMSTYGVNMQVLQNNIETSTYKLL